MPQTKEERAAYTKECPKSHAVDHIIPLQGSGVTGRMNNLQWLSKADNLAKQNHYSHIDTLWRIIYSPLSEAI